MSKGSPTELANRFASMARERGFTWSASGVILRVEKRIAPDDRSAFADAETDASILLGTVPTTMPGSVWGTDGISVGGAVALRTGHFRMNKSGVSRRFVSALAKVGGAA